MRLAGWLALGVFFALVFSDVSWAVFERVEGIDKTSIHKVDVSSLDDKVIYAVSLDTLLRSEDKGQEWQKIFVAKGEEIKDVSIDKYLYDTAYVATQNYVYRVKNERSEKIFTLPPEVEATCVRKYKDDVYVGTTEGMYCSNEDFLKWKKLEGLPQDLVIYALDFSSQNMYVLSDKGVYISHSGERFQKSVVVKPLDAEEEEEMSCFPRVVRVDIFDENVVYLGTTNGLYLSGDAGTSWQKALISRVENADICGISQTPLEKNSVYLATDRGIFNVNVEEKSYHILFEGLPTRDVFWVDFDRGGKLFAATSKGLFLKEEFSPSQSRSQLDTLIKNEPSIREIQEIALRYNEVHPEKIRKWRNALKYRALFPEVSLDYDKTVYGTSSNGGQFAVGPRDWGVSFSWDAGDLLWNSYEDDVDTRSRLITQLRNNILDDINGIYFERVRVKMELANGAYKDESGRTKKELRFRELTAALDGYTGGHFSKRLQELQ